MIENLWRQSSSPLLQITRVVTMPLLTELYFDPVVITQGQLMCSSVQFLTRPLPIIIACGKPSPSVYPTLWWSLSDEEVWRKEADVRPEMEKEESFGSWKDSKPQVRQFPPSLICKQMSMVHVFEGLSDQPEKVNAITCIPYKWCIFLHQIWNVLVRDHICWCKCNL